MTTADILDALHQPLTYSELRCELSAVGAHNGTMSDDRKLSGRLQALRKQGRIAVRRTPGFPGARCEWVKIPLASEAVRT